MFYQYGDKLKLIFSEGLFDFIKLKKKWKKWRIHLLLKWDKLNKDKENLKIKEKQPENEKCYVHV